MLLENKYLVRGCYWRIAWGWNNQLALSSSLWDLGLLIWQAYFTEGVKKYMCEEVMVLINVLVKRSLWRKRSRSLFGEEPVPPPDMVWHGDCEEVYSDDEASVMARNNWRGLTEDLRRLDQKPVWWGARSSPDMLNCGEKVLVKKYVIVKRSHWRSWSSRSLLMRSWSLPWRGRHARGTKAPERKPPPSQQTLLRPYLQKNWQNCSFVQLEIAPFPK